MGYYCKVFSGGIIWEEVVSREGVVLDRVVDEDDETASIG